MFKMSSNLEDLTELLEKLNRTNLDELGNKRLSSESSSTSDSKSKEKKSKSLSIPLPPPDEISYDRVLSENMKHMVTDQTTQAVTRRRYRKTGFNNYNYDARNQVPRGNYDVNYDAPRRPYNFGRANYDYRMNFDYEPPRRQYRRFWGNGNSYNRMDEEHNGYREPYNNYRGNNLNYGGNYEMNRQSYYRSPGYPQRYPNYEEENQGRRMYRKQTFFNPNYMKNVDNYGNEVIHGDYKYDNEVRPNDYQYEPRYINDQRAFVNQEPYKRGRRSRAPITREKGHETSDEITSMSKIRTSKRTRKIKYSYKYRTSRADKESSDKDATIDGHANQDVKTMTKTKRVNKKSDEKFTTKLKRVMKDSDEKMLTKTKRVNKSSEEKVLMKTKRTSKDSAEKMTPKRLNKEIDDNMIPKAKRISKTSHEKVLTKLKGISREVSEKITPKYKRLIKEVVDKPTTIIKRRILYERREVPRDFMKAPRRIPRSGTKKNIPL